jgi:GcrA cell cycle regulator
LEVILDFAIIDTAAGSDARTAAQHTESDDATAAEPRGAHWTPERIERLKELWSQGLSLSEIAKALGLLTRNQVVGKVHRLKLPGRPSPLTAAARSWYRGAKSEPVASTEAFPVAALLDLPGARLLLGLKPLPVPEPVAPPVAEKAPERRARPAPAAREKVDALFDAAAFGVSAAVQSLRSGACKWPIGDPKDADFHFCCAPMKGKAYCDAHAKLAYMEPHSRLRVPRAA